jgi:dienelactone hydrolase
MHFFIEHTQLQLTSQASSGDGFGPSSSDPANKYDVSANFQLASDAKAFACQAGHLIVTDFFDVAAAALDPSLVNVILKPTSGLGITFPSVKYYVYRGIKRDSFFSGGSFNATGSGNTDTVRKMWEDWLANAASSPDPLAPSDVGFDATLAGTTQIEEIFGKAAVTLAGAPLRARQVSEGEWIGTFGSAKKICFEVVVEAELLDLNIEYARKSKVQIDISAMTAIASPTPAQLHALRCEKEKILAFVDPAALFGMHFSVGVSGIGLSTAPKRDAVATTFLIPFSTATRVYLDIRSDKGYSYNFYDNYGGGGANPDLIQIKPGVATAFVNDVYLNQGWPLFSHSGWTGPAAKVNLGLRLRIDDNTEPLLFVEDARRLPAGAKNFLGRTQLRNGAAVDWSKTFNLKLDGSGSGASKTCVATHVRLQYLKQKAGAVVNPRLLQFNHRLDTVFGGIDLPMAGSAAVFRELRNDKVGLAEGPDFAHVPDTGMYFDPDVVLLFGSSRVAHRTNHESYPVTDFATSALDNVVRSPVFPSNIVFSRWSIVEGGTTIRLIDLSVYNKGTKNTSVDGIHFLGLKRSELSRLQATTGFGPVHQRFLVFDEAADWLDDNGFPYKQYAVKVQGLDAAGQRILVAPSPAVNVFGAGANMFCSSDFTGFVTLPDVPPDPMKMKPWEHVFSGTYGFTDLDVKAVSASGRVEANDIGNDLTLSKPKVRLRARYFFPIDAAQPPLPAVPAISARKTSYPLIVIAHGNGQKYTEYDRLARHLAHNGFIVASINLLIMFVSGKLTRVGLTNTYTHINSLAIIVVYDHSTQTVSVDTGAGLTAHPSWVSGTDFDIDLVGGIPDSITFLRHNPDVDGMGSRGRANVIFRHLEVLKRKFGTNVENKIGFIGHSRGGEAVVRAAGLIGASTAPSDLQNIAAVISLAPTDQYEKENLTQDIPYFVLYGSRDTDVKGSSMTNRVHNPNPAIPAGCGGFSLYDRAVNAVSPVVPSSRKVKSMAFVYGASHNGFITTSDRDPKFFPPGSAPGSPGTNISTFGDRREQAAAGGYMNAFLRQHLFGEEIWKSYFTGEFIPGSIGSNQIFQQYKDLVVASANSRTIDDFENAPHNWATSSSGQPVAHSRSGTGLAEGLLNKHAPLDVDSPHETNGLKVTDWAAADTLTFTVLADVSAWTHFSFRITQVARRTNSPINTMKVAIVDANTHRHEVVLSRNVPNPDNRPDDPALTKSALMTIRMPLADYWANGVDRTQVQSVELVFPATGAGNIEVDDLEFTK